MYNVLLHQLQKTFCPKLFEMVFANCHCYGRLTCVVFVSHCTETQKAKEREERVRLARERREQAEQKRLEELRQSIARHQEIRRKQEEDRRRRMDEMKRREEEHRSMVEERKKRLQDEENVRVASLVYNMT